MFIDQIDLFIGTQAQGGPNSDKIIAIKQELINCMASAQKENQSSMIVIATTDQPWNLENDLLNQMKTKIQTKMISAQFRQKYLQNLGGTDLSDADIADILQKTEGIKINDFKKCIEEAQKQP